MEVKVKRTRKGGPAQTAKVLNDVSRESISLAAYVWHRKIRPKHFTHAGATEYSYTPRSPRYNKRKLREHGHTYPLVNSGDSERDTERNARIEATATRTKGATAKVIMRARNLNWRNPKSRINMRDELTRTSSRDKSAMREVFRITHAAGLKRAGGS